MGKLAKKLKEATQTSVSDASDNLRVDFDDHSDRVSTLPIQEAFSIAMKCAFLWLFFQFYLFLTTSLPEFENYVDGELLRLNSAVKEEIKESSQMVESLPDAKGALTAESIRQIMRKSPSKPSGEGIRRH